MATTPAAEKIYSDVDLRGPLADGREVHARVPVIEQVEVLRDGAAAQYGSDAIAGVMNIALKRSKGCETVLGWGQYSRGDGENWLASAYCGVGFAMGGGTDVAMHAAGITLMRGDPMLVAAALDISRRTVSKIRQNLFWAFAYNAAGIPLAALGYLSPVLAGAAMALSSVSVVSNALLLKRWKPPVQR